MSILLAPPIAFLIYLALTAGASLLARRFAGEQASTVEPSSYASGEAAPGTQAAPGYRQFFTVALFFAVLHLGVLIAGSGGLTPVTGAYLGGLALVLIALILG